MLLLASIIPSCEAEARNITVGIIVPATDPFSLEANEALESSLRSWGLTGSIRIIKQTPQPDLIALKNTARKLIALKVDIIITYGTPATMATIGEKSGIPVIYGGVYKPVSDTIDRPMTYGVRINPPLSSITRYMASAIGKSNIGILYCSNEKDSLLQMEQMMRFTRIAGLTGKNLDMKMVSNVSSSLSGADVGFFFITTSTCTHSSSIAIERISRNRGIPVATLIKVEDLNPVIAHYCSAAEVGRVMARHLKTALEGGTPPRTSDPCPSSAELIFDIGEARRLGLSMPMELVTGATKVIY